MGSVARKECHVCNIRRSANCMRQVSVKVKSGTSGISFSLNPQRKKSTRINSGRNYYRHVSKWECSTRAAHGNTNYYKDLAVQEAKDAEAKEIEDINKKEAKLLEGVKKKDEIRFKTLSLSIFSKYLVNGRLDDASKFKNSKEYTTLESEYTNVLKGYPGNKCSNSLDPAVVIISNNLELSGVDIALNEEAKLHKALRIKFYKNSSFFVNLFKIIFWLVIGTFSAGIFSGLLINNFDISSGLSAAISIILVVSLILFKLNRNKNKQIYKISKAAQPIITKLQSLMHKSYLEGFIVFVESSGEGVDNIKYIVNKIKNDSANANVDDESQLKSGPPASEQLDSKAGATKQSARAQARYMYEHELFFDISCVKVAREMTLGNGIISPDEEEALLTFLGEKNIEDKALFDDILRANIPVMVVLKMVKSKYINDESTLMDFLNNLFFIAESDGKVTENELNFIKKSASILGVSSDELDVKIKERLVGFTESQAGEYILTENHDVLDDVLDEQDWEENDSGF